MTEAMLLHGTNLEMISLLVKATRNEMSIQGGNTNVFIDSINKGKECDYAIIFCPNLITSYVSYILSHFSDRLAKMPAGKFLLVIVSNDKNASFFPYGSNGRLKRLHVPDRFSTLQRRKVLLKCTTKWGANQPSDALLGIVAEKMVALPTDEAGQDAQLRTFCQKVYSLGLARLKERNGLTVRDTISGEDIHVGVQDWREDFNKMVGSGEKWEEEDSAVQQDKEEIAMQSNEEWLEIPELEKSSGLTKEENLSELFTNVYGNCGSVHITRRAK
ncbi:uncharacterized protein LOC118439123 isoform X2 [Folsomia candida]|uniref:Uncharacterized protein n=1 Tax=Folsomia candida TaxID=158441 RepID=A0A226D7M3_FOLCA|nr:uncharacterized protein LOC118439123 isoform X2 [Folsomia candida]OXA41219.1 hypothetical protein Fcan01_24074 [Folsomia candida]